MVCCLTGRLIDCSFNSSLIQTGYKAGCVTEERYKKTKDMEYKLSENIELLKAYKMSRAQWSNILRECKAEISLAKTGNKLR